MKFFTRSTHKKYSYFVDFCKNYIKIIRTTQEESSEEVVFDKIYTLKLDEVSEEKVKGFFSKLFSSTNNLKLVGFVPRRNTTIKYLKLPSDDIKEIEKMVAFQVKEKIPYEIEEITYDYKTQFIDSEGYSHLMLVIAHKRRVKELIDNFQQYGLVLDSILLDVDALCNWFRFEYKMSDIPVGVLDVDIDKINLIVVKNGEVDFSRNIPMGSYEFEAEDNKYALQKLKDVIGRSIDVYNKNSQKRLSKLVITGAENNLELIKENLQNTFSGEIEIRSCFENISLGFASEKFKEEETQFLSFTYLVGAALPFEEKKFDFLPSERKAEKELENKKSIVKKVGLLILFLLIVITVLVGYKFYYFHRKLSMLEKKLENVSPEADKIEKKVSLIKKLSAYLKNRDYSLDVLRQIYAKVPSEVYLTNLDFTKGEDVTLRGEAKEVSEVFTFVSDLERSDKFKSVKADSVNVNQRTEGNIVTFEIYCELGK